MSLRDELRARADKASPTAARDAQIETIKTHLRQESDLHKYETTLNIRLLPEVKKVLELEGLHLGYVGEDQWRIRWDDWTDGL